MESILLVFNVIVAYFAVEIKLSLVKEDAYMMLTEREVPRN